MGINNTELNYLLNGSFTKATLKKLIIMTDEDCKNWNGNPLFREFQINVVGTSVGYWKALKRIREWATSVLMEHLKDRKIEKEAAAKRAAAARLPKTKMLLRRLSLPTSTSRAIIWSHSTTKDQHLNCLRQKKYFTLPESLG
ncbi:hypothetical protein NXS19_004194 [Fusarium pseudograminearum]|nr:hypothetical protein NXS19_004194 [Fusarium pseudograminearum]